MNRNIFDDVLFAVSREDHRIEKQIVKNHNVMKMLTICSGGCVPLSLKAIFPDLQIMALDINQHQIDHVKEKSEAIIKGDFKTLNIGQQNDKGINQSGKFEKMFQSLRKTFFEQVSNMDKVKEFFDSKTVINRRETILISWLEHANIREPFEQVFNDRAIETVFSDRATKQGEKGTYVDYFLKKITQGLRHPNAYNNPFLQHIFLGYYKARSMFPYMQNKHNQDVDYFLGSILDVASIRSFDFVNLSNLFDWSDNAFVLQCTKMLSNLKKNSVVLLRQLNNDRNWFPYFNDGFYEDSSFNQYWQKNDRSMFYNHFRLFIKK
tara:strand:- start:203 stop:1165 length:963 start_codon:yes stop_codon:yes gene_type:complete